TAGGGPLEPEVVALDAEASRAVFHVRTRWGQRIAGRLPALGGERRILADGRHQVRIALDAAGVELGGAGRLEEIARSDRFFDADAHPQIVFLSDPYPASVVEHGGQVHGWLEMRGVRRPESFTLEPASCPEPGTACPVIAHGSVDRGDYGMDAMRVALTGSVHFDLRLWLEPMP
ncbi:YceI family protein, partial [Novilysobacter defluvii]